MWHKSENSNSTQPAAIDRNSSRVYVYVRKDFVFIEESEDKPAHWEYLEARIRREDWDLFEGLMSLETTTSDLGIALEALLDFMIGG